MTDIKQLSIILLIGLISCSPKIVYVPVETNTNVRDSVVTRIVDSTIYHHKTINKDYSNLLDTLHINGERSSMSAYADTTNFTIKGELNEDPYVEKIVYKTRTEYRDSLINKEVPVEVPVEKIVKICPWYMKALSFIGTIAIIALAIFIVLKLKI